jgi:hypothetical protein
MDQDREKVALEERLNRCRALAKAFPDGPKAQHIRELEAELKNQICAEEK